MILQKPTKRNSEKGKQNKNDYTPLEEMVPSSYFLTKITSTKSRGEIMPIAAEGVTVLQTEISWEKEMNEVRNNILPQFIFASLRKSIMTTHKEIKMRGGRFFHHALREKSRNTMSQLY